MTAFRTFEDFREGEEIDLGTKLVTADEIIAFAGEFDPQPFHLDEAAGKASMLGGLAASGWHTIAMLMRLLCDNLLLASTCMGSPGVDKVVWKRPVLAGDELHATAKVLGTRELKSKPGLGVVRFVFTVSNQRGEMVMTQENAILFGREEAAA
ncbi:MaoC family dehydratase [Rhizobiales bacterium]|uniref:MaoC family dehydratase n=1 Tax=Hongsoonwoonella zoysiae TaxID=2821844 RepID=UPI00155FCDDF|nr:MaoC family dehydratase [Hongsoonwoonella zoysiae]NRG17633.1 MaoC family dehydratase [Hongsoonwoonella zoysiae]